MTAALELLSRGHEVTLYEASDSLGGTLKFSEKVAFKKDLRKFKDYLVDQVMKSDVKVKLNTQADSAMLNGSGSDIVIAAWVLRPLFPPSPVLMGTMSLRLWIPMAGKRAWAMKLLCWEAGRSAVRRRSIWGVMGKRVTLLEMRDGILMDASQTHKDEMIYEIGNCENVNVITSAMCTGINRDSVAYAGPEGDEIIISTPQVVLSAGMKAASDKAEELRAGLDCDFYAIGDCQKIGTVESATKSA